MSKQETIEAILAQVERHKETAIDLYATNKYDFCLFLWHLIIEKLLKAVIVSRDKEYLFSHKLTKLAEQAGITLSQQNIEELQEITAFNIDSRYDNIKLAFYKKATKEYANKWIKICTGYYDLLYKHVKN